MKFTNNKKSFEYSETNVVSGTNRAFDRKALIAWKLTYVFIIK